MTDLETLLADRLDARADRVPVGPVPLDAVVREAAVRRRRPWVVLGAAAAVIVVAAGLVVALPSNTAPEPRRPAEPVLGSASPTPTDQVESSGSRVGGRLSVAVPRTWTVEGTGCGGVPGDVVIAASGFVDCPVRWAPGVEAIRFDVERPGPEARELVVDGRPVLRTPTRCERRPTFRRCSAVLWDPETETGLRVLSATDAATVDDILATAAIAEDLVSVPGPFGFSGVAFTLGHFRQFAEGRGLVVRMPRGSDERAWDFGRTTVSPAPGTAVPRGTVVRVRLHP